MSAPPPAASPFRTAAERESDRIAKREAVLLAAVRHFNARGFAATSLDDVAASLGVTKPVIYRYLGSKERVLLECVTRGLDQLQAAAEAMAGRPGTGLDRLSLFLERYAEIIMSEFGTCVIRTQDSALSVAGRAQFRLLKSRIDGALRALIVAGVADGSVHSDDVRLTAFALAGALNWTAQWFAPGGASPAPVVARDIVRVLIAGLRPA